MCGGGSSRGLRHNNIRDILAKAARDVVFRTDIKHGGGLGDQRRPGDVIVYNWRDGRHLLIDVAVINPLCSSNIESLISEGVGGAATAYCKIKERLYRNLDPNKYELLPFIIETTGGFSKTAYGLIKEIKRPRESANCQSNYECPYNYDRKPLQSAINVELQKSNSRMVLERTPSLEDLIASDMLKCELTVAKKKENAVKSLQALRRKPTRIHEEMKGTQKEKDFAARPTSKIIKSRKCEKGKEKPPARKKSGQFQEKGIRESGGTRLWNMRNCLVVSPRKPPDNALNDIPGTGKVVNMWVERGERTMAQKLDKSQNTSTSLVTNTVLLKEKAASSEMDWRTGECRNGSLLQGSGNSQIKTLEDVTEKVQWEPPSVRNLKQE